MKFIFNIQTIENILIRLYLCIITIELITLLLLFLISAYFAIPILYNRAKSDRIDEESDYETESTLYSYSGESDLDEGAFSDTISYFSSDEVTVYNVINGLNSDFLYSDIPMMSSRQGSILE